MNIPEQYIGHKTSSEIVNDNLNGEEIKSVLSKGRSMFFDINNWHEVLTLKVGAFQLIDRTGTAINRFPQVGDHIRIKIKGPSNKIGKGFDWVRIIEIKNDPFQYGITLKPCALPNCNSGSIAHFFGDAATNTLQVEALDGKIVGKYDGRNEIVNLNRIPIQNKIRNFIVAKSSLLGFSFIQWRDLLSGIITP